VENLISREALSGSLERFQPRFGIVTGASETISKIKAPRIAKAIKTSRKQNLPAWSTLASAGTTASRRLVRNILTPRFAMHLVAITLVGVIVLTGSGANAKMAKTSLVASVPGRVSVLDTSSQASVVAEVAKKANLVVAPEADHTATRLSSQVALPTTTDDSLAKRTVVETAGAATRTITSYSVANGDTLSTIASRFGITTDTLKWANSLADVDSLSPGQSLTILPVSGLLYTVKAGDSPESLAGAYQANAAQIVSYNNAEVKGLSAGQQIIIPDGVRVDAPKTVARVASVPSAARSNIAPTLTRYAFGGNGYAYGYCTYYVAGRRSVPSGWGNANTWYYAAQSSGFRVGSTPVPGAIAWTSAGYYGHVAYVEQVSGGQVLVSEMNFNGNWNRVTSRWASASSFRYIY
jgi:N-acetylmuramoyl-L-alanine amidase